MHDPLIGTLLDGRYRVEQRVAAGGMSTVYRGMDTRLDRVVALKVMHPSLVGDAEFSARFIREAKAIAKLAHPNVVNIFDQGADGHTVFLAMEYVPGRTLRDLLRDRGALSVRAALDIMEPVLAALGAAHRAGLVHRDVKPENVLITDGGLVKVADFGLVRLLSGADSSAAGTSTAAGTVLGTVSYLAPEQIQQDSTTDQRVDVYAAGILLYEMLTGAKPHTGDNAAVVMYRHLHEDVPAPSLIAPVVGRELDAIVAAATARNPQARPWDAVELLASLQKARRALTPAQLDAEPPASSRPSPLYPTAEATAVITTALPPVERTSVLDVPPDLLLASRPVNDPPPPPRSTRRRRRSRAPLIWTAVLAAVVVLVSAISYSLSSAVYATVPSVLGQTQAQATATLDNAGLHGNFSQQFSETVDPGKVISTDPGVGQKIRKSAPVNVVLSRGPERITVPDLTGRASADAQKALTAARLAVGVNTEEYSDTVPQGAVIRTTPAAGQQLSPNSPVSLVVSKGMTPVPNVAGMTKDEATQTLSDAGFKLQANGLDLFGAGKAGTQTPTAGTPLRQGSTVVVNFSLF